MLHRLILRAIITFAVSWAAPLLVIAQDPPNFQVLKPGLVHLRSGTVREWASFPEQAEAAHLETRFSGRKNPGEACLQLRQQDVKQTWRVLLNGKSLGELVKDENDQVLYLAIPAGGLIDGENVLRIESPARSAALSDDIRVGELLINPRPRADALSEATAVIHVVDGHSREPLPARITIVNSDGALQALGPSSGDQLAVRAGVVYTADGHARIHLPAGHYTIYAGRGFEYSLARAELNIGAAEMVERTLTIRREVATPGYVTCDTHIHTLTHSGHGDASIAERMITLAGEGIELPIATDHNVQIDYEPHATLLGVRQYFTPVVGNEVTTTLGHFNVWPTTTSARVPDFKQKSWSAIFDRVFATPGVKIAVLNHARDLHGATRPFGPKLFNAAIGENIDGWPMRFNAMEIINSGATQTDPLRLVHDWIALLNRGYSVTPVGSSDSHDVSRYIVGQGRTYIRADDHDPATIDIAAVVDNFLAGRVLVSYGLLVDMTVDDKYRVGDLAQFVGDQVNVELRVAAPSWSKATQLRLYANGGLLKTLDFSNSTTSSHQLKIDRPKHDVHLVAVATGPGITSPYWPTAKPYQPASPDWEPYTLAVAGPIWLDADGDGRRSTPRDYAERLFAEARGDVTKLCESLRQYDAATAAQAAHLLHQARVPLEGHEVFRSYLDALRETQRAQAEP
jgi:hypothetical protein